MDFYLEGLDRQVRKPEENLSVGLLLCASKNDEVVEYAMSRTLSPMMVVQYQLQLLAKVSFVRSCRNCLICRNSKKTQIIVILDQR